MQTSPERGLILALVLSAAALGCGQDNTLSYTVTPTPGEATPTPLGPTPPPRPEIDISTEAIDFGEKGVGCTLTQSLTIQNLGGANLGVSAPTFAVGSDPAFSSTSGPVNILPSESATMEVTYAVSREGEATALMLISSNDPEEGTLAIDLSGEGAPLQWRDESFTQVGAGVVDVLLALDMSSSGTDLMGAFAVNLPVLSDSLDNGGLDWQLGWISMDPIEKGLLKGSFGPEGEERPFVTSADPDEYMTEMQNDLKSRLISPATNQTPAFQLITATFNEANLAGPHDGFLREDAQLLVVAVSVHDETSQTVSGTTPVSEFRDTLFALKGGDSEKIQFVGVVGTELSSCSYKDGYRYQELLDSGVDGFIEDICYQAWSNTLELIAQEALDLKASFSLEARPGYLELIEVKVGDIIVPSDPDNGYQYEEETNSISLYGSAVPEPGATVSIRYPLPGECD